MEYLTASMMTREALMLLTQHKTGEQFIKANAKIVQFTDESLLGDKYLSSAPNSTYAESRTWSMDKFSKEFIVPLFIRLLQQIPKTTALLPLEMELPAGIESSWECYKFVGMRGIIYWNSKSQEIFRIDVLGVKYNPPKLAKQNVSIRRATR